jgi:predicted NAD/FAD-binding protein
MNEPVYIIDWDVVSVGPERFAFYRQLAKLKKELGLQGTMSSMSVMITSDEGLAERVFQIAKQYAKTVHLYKGRQVR